MKEILKELYHILTLRILFPLQYLRYRNRPLKKKVVFVESELPALSGSMQVLYDTLKKQGEYQLKIHCLRESFVSTGEFVRNALACLKDLADAEYVFLCYGSRVVSCIPKRKETRIVQLWHGCGAFKRFGLSSSDLLFGGSRRNYEKYPYYRNLDYVTVSSPEVVWAYEEAMGLEEDPCQVVPVGVSRTDIFFREDFLQKAYEHLKECIPEKGNRKVILYAPTFRGNVSSAEAPDQFDVEAMCRAFSEEYILLIKHHPVIKQRPDLPECVKGFAYDVTQEMSIDELLCISDICISDYSSLIYEFSLFERPMLFYAYDLEDYHDWRGFYYDYEELTPGPVFKEMGDMIQYLKEIDRRFDKKAVQDFRKKFMSACDGHATERLWKLLKNGGN